MCEGGRGRALVVGVVGGCEEGEDPDLRAPHVSERGEREREGSWAAGARLVGPAWLRWAARFRFFFFLFLSIFLFFFFSVSSVFFISL